MLPSLLVLCPPTLPLLHCCCSVAIASAPSLHSLSRTNSTYIEKIKRKKGGTRVEEREIPPPNSRAYQLIILKNGGRVIYCGPLGRHSSRVIEYFESISGVRKIRDNYNPPTWMLEVTSASMEAALGVDFAVCTNIFYFNFVQAWSINKEGVDCEEVYDVKDHVNNLLVANSISCFIPQGAGIKVNSWSGASKLLNPSKDVKCLALVNGRLYSGCMDNSIQEIDLATGTLTSIQSGARKLLAKANRVNVLQVHDGLIYAASSSIEGTSFKYSWRQ